MLGNGSSACSPFLVFGSGCACARQLSNPFAAFPAVWLAYREAGGADGGGEGAEGMAIDAMDEDALLQQALALSMQVDQATPAPAAGKLAATSLC